MRRIFILYSFSATIHYSQLFTFNLPSKPHATFIDCPLYTFNIRAWVCIVSPKFINSILLSNQSNQRRVLEKVSPKARSAFLSIVLQNRAYPIGLSKSRRSRAPPSIPKLLVVSVEERWACLCGARVLHAVIKPLQLLCSCPSHMNLSQNTSVSNSSFRLSIRKLL